MHLGGERAGGKGRCDAARGRGGWLRQPRAEQVTRVRRGLGSPRNSWAGWGAQGAGRVGESRGTREALSKCCALAQESTQATTRREKPAERQETGPGAGRRRRREDTRGVLTAWHTVGTPELLAFFLQERAE